MIRRALASVVACVAAGPALALSCLPWGPTDAYLEAKHAVASYVVVEGRLHFDEGKLPKTDWDKQELTPQETNIPARVTGMALQRAGWLTPFDGAVTLQVQCYGPWCAGANDGADYVMFLEQRDAGYLLQVNPCGGFALDNSGGEAADKVLACHQGRRCRPSKRR
jgi:hypothetical protein